MAESLKELGYQVLIVTALGATVATIAILNDPAVQNGSENSGNGARTSDQQSQQQETPENHTQNYQADEPIPDYTPGYLTRDNPRSRFKIVPDPQNLGRLCVSKTNETPKNTLVGMTVVAAGDVNTYDGSGTIYNGNGTEIGIWDANQKLIAFEDLTAPAYADSVACGDK